MTKYFIHTILWVICLPHLLVSQRVLDVEYQGTITLANVQVLIDLVGLNIQAKNGVDLYKFVYLATGTDMNPDTASGLLMLPREIQGALPVMIYQHGTTDGRSDVPSRLAGGYQLGGVFAAMGMIAIAPDYLGLGESRGFHPFVHAPTEGSAAADMYFALLEYAENQDLELTKDLFISGYSQGGHGAMAAHKYFQDQFPEINITASLPMSGPYSISGIMRDIAFTDEEYFFPVYLVYSSRGIKEVDGSLYENIEDVFKPEFLPDIQNYIDTEEGLFDLNETLIASMISTYGKSVPKFIFRDSFLNVIETDDSHPFNQALRISDLYNWIPGAPMRILFCPADEQIPFSNALLADSTMNALGAADVQSIDVSEGEDFSHSACVLPALRTGIPWILSFLDTNTPVDDILVDPGTFVLYPNPAIDQITVEYEDVIQEISIFSLRGKLLIRKKANSRAVQLDVSHLHPGSYILQSLSDDKVLLSKLVVN